MTRRGPVPKPGHPESTLETLRQHHSQVSEAHAVRRGELLSSLQCGTMVPWGGRVPNGGCAGSGYGSYAHMSATTDDDVKNMFAHSYVSSGYLY